MSKATKKPSKKQADAAAVIPDPSSYTPPPAELSAPPSDPVPEDKVEAVQEAETPQPAPLPGVSSDMQAAVAAALAAHAKALSVPPPAASKKGATIRKSAVQSPVKLVHEISQRMYEANNNVTRKDVIAACEAAGIATHTAKTQYQLWRSASKNDAAAAAASRGLIAPPPAIGRTEPKLVSVRPTK